MILVIHIISGSLFFITSLASILHSEILRRMFIPSFIATGSSGALLLFQSDNMTVVCVRFIVLSMLALSIKALTTKAV